VPLPSPSVISKGTCPRAPPIVIVWLGCASLSIWPCNGGKWNGTGSEDLTRGLLFSRLPLSTAGNSPREFPVGAAQKALNPLGACEDVLDLGVPRSVVIPSLEQMRAQVLMTRQNHPSHRAVPRDAPSE
jgi:hypothetical protein